jgi:hypothetical protein
MLATCLSDNDAKCMQPMIVGHIGDANRLVKKYSILEQETCVLQLRDVVSGSHQKKSSRERLLL